MPDKNTYVILTGSKNNAGDFLIKYRAKQLFATLRPDREIVDYDAWKPLTPEQLEKINNSKALILTGGPALQYNMYPGIYALTPDLNDIKVPVIMMGVGYKDHGGTWERTHKYSLSTATENLLKKVKASGYLSSVRDYHTLNVLALRGYQNIVMTGCPALYDLDFLNKPFQDQTEIKKINYSLGVSYITSPSMNKLMKETILASRDAFAGKTFQVLFHHQINLANPHQKEMIAWLNSNNIVYKDISGGVENLINEYASSDFHIGFRVHAHIFMNSISKPSVLLNEDGRGKALYQVINGLSFDAYNEKGYTLADRIRLRLKMPVDLFEPNSDLPKDIKNAISYELAHQVPRMSMTRKCIDQNFHQMKTFLSQLP